MPRHTTSTASPWTVATAIPSNIFDHADIHMDNNTAERGLRKLTIGRKNWLKREEAFSHAGRL